MDEIAWIRGQAMDLSERDRMRAARRQAIRENIERLEARAAGSKDEKTRARLHERIRREQGRLGRV